MRSENLSIKIDKCIPREPKLYKHVQHTFLRPPNVQVQGKPRTTEWSLLRGENETQQPRLRHTWKYQFPRQIPRKVCDVLSRTMRSNLIRQLNQPMLRYEHYLDLMSYIKSNQSQRHFGIGLDMGGCPTHIYQANQGDIRELRVSCRMLKNILSKFRLLYTVEWSISEGTWDKMGVTFLAVFVGPENCV